MTDEQKKAKIDAWMDILGKATAQLSILDVKVSTYGFFMERRDIVKTLRSLCKEFGDNDWPDELHLSDVIEKHLFNYVAQS